MEYIYAALLLHNAKKEITEDGIKNVLKSVGIEADNAKLKGLVATLKEVDIAKAIEKAAIPVAAAPAGAGEAKAEKKKEEVPEVTEEAAAEGLGSLFG